MPARMVVIVVLSKQSKQILGSHDETLRQCFAFSCILCIAEQFQLSVVDLTCKIICENFLIPVFRRNYSTFNADDALFIVPSPYKC